MFLSRKVIPMPTQPSHFTSELLRIVISLAVVFLTAFAMVGDRLRIVTVLLLVCGGMSAGVSLGRMMERRHAGNASDKQNGPSAPQI